MQQPIEGPRVEGAHGAGIHADRALALIETVVTEITFAHPGFIPGMELRDPVRAGLATSAAGGFPDAFVPIGKDDPVALAFKDRRRGAY